MIELQSDYLSVCVFKNRKGKDDDNSELFPHEI